MATHSSVLAWRIPGTGEPGGLPFMGGTEWDTTEVTQQQQLQHTGSIIVTCWLQGMQASGTRAHQLCLMGRRVCSFSSYGIQAQLLRGMWNLSTPGIKPMSSVLAVRFLSTTPPGKSKIYLLLQHVLLHSLLHILIKHLQICSSEYNFNAMFEMCYNCFPLLVMECNTFIFVDPSFRDQFL